MKDKGCGTCSHVEEFSEDENGNKTVKCELNEYQMFFPFAEECIHWDKASTEEQG